MGELRNRQECISLGSTDAWIHEVDDHSSSGSSSGIKQSKELHLHSHRVVICVCFQVGTANFVSKHGDHAVVTGKGEREREREEGYRPSTYTIKMITNPMTIMRIIPIDTRYTQIKTRRREELLSFSESSS